MAYTTLAFRLLSGCIHLETLVWIPDVWDVLWTNRCWQFGH